LHGITEEFVLDYTPELKRQAMEILHQEAMRSFKASGGVNSSTG